MSTQRRLRVGIDVGGTFTHAVAVDAATLELVGRAKVPTTHAAREGVARGVVESLLTLLAACHATPDEVALIAHSTTQATNALLEGDVAPVGVVGLGSGVSRVLAARQTRIAPIRLAPGRTLRLYHRFIPSERATDAAIRSALEALRRDGAEVIVAAEAFSVDDPAREQRVVELAGEMGLPATATHQVSRLHGLRIRTRTAVINACMIPRMLATADLTERAVREAGIRAPLMIMRSDGGVMDIEQMRRRPILTMLSGPAAGVAAALLFARVSDGVFLEVGGTSTDISVIRNGRCQVRSAEIGGQKLHLSTLDVRTLGVAGGSLAYLRDGRVSQVGPRSAHIAGLPYLSFTERSPASFRAARHEFEGDTFLAVDAGGQKLAVTPTCASNMLGLVPAGDPAAGRLDAIRAGFEALTPGGAEAQAAAILDAAARRVAPVVEGLVRDYKLDRGLVRLIGGGGGASAIVPYLARFMKLPYETVECADVISAIGVALALVRDTVERTVISPSEEDIRSIREEALASVLRMGAAPDTVEVFVEVDSKRNLLRATAEGSTEIRQQDLRARALSPAEREQLVATSMGITAPGQAAGAAHAPQRADRDVECPMIATATAGFEVWRARRRVRRLFGLVREVRTLIRVLDAAGSIRWASNHADMESSTAAAAEATLERLAERYTRYTDAGATIPRCFVLLAGRIIDPSGLVEMKQVLEVLRLELRRHAAGAPCVVLVDAGGR